MSKDTATSSATATSSRPLNLVQRQNTGLVSKPAGGHNLDLEKGTPGGGGVGEYYSGEAGAPPPTPYTNMLLSLDKIPRRHNILVLLFVWILLAGFVILPGSFTSAKRKQDGEASVQVPAGGGGGKLSLTPANTAALVIGFVCIVAGAFGSAWLALRWRRNYVWLLNKLYMPLILDALAGLLATVIGVYTQQAGEWSSQAIVAAILEGGILGLSIILFLLYNYWLLRRIRGDDLGEGMGYGKEKKKKKKRKDKMGFFARFGKSRKMPPVTARKFV
ncbi:hypothetical protein C8A03DRAFT_45575 [Achaetomium macrosporum]|uniref:Uncharacterized protein n=1 Tax=Achaetomium macrosporum TaxID=79813 RepID=A0AAN7C6R2_9PEZI|nr:hypothetical protein C8A03DRAFT_45575 [Achaetomium macrosporum]